MSPQGVQTRYALPMLPANPAPTQAISIPQALRWKPGQLLKWPVPPVFLGSFKCPYINLEA